MARAVAFAAAPVGAARAPAQGAIAPGGENGGAGAVPGPGAVDNPSAIRLPGAPSVVAPHRPGRRRFYRPIVPEGDQLVGARAPVNDVVLARGKGVDRPVGPDPRGPLEVATIRLWIPPAHPYSA